MYTILMCVSMKKVRENGEFLYVSRTVFGEKKEREKLKFFFLISLSSDKWIKFTYRIFNQFPPTLIIVSRFKKKLLYISYFGGYECFISLAYSLNQEYDN